MQTTEGGGSARSTKFTPFQWWRGDGGTPVEAKMGKTNALASSSKLAPFVSGVDTRRGQPRRFVWSIRVARAEIGAEIGAQNPRSKSVLKIGAENRIEADRC